MEAITGEIAPVVVGLVTGRVLILGLGLSTVSPVLFAVVVAGDLLGPPQSLLLGSAMLFDCAKFEVLGGLRQELACDLLWWCRPDREDSCCCVDRVWSLGCGRWG